MDRDIESLIYKVLEDKATDSEAAVLASWRRMSPENEGEFQSFRILSVSAQADDAHSDLERGRNKLMMVIQSLEKKRRNTIRLRKIVSVVLFVLTLIVSVWNVVSEVNANSAAMYFRNSSLSQVATFLAKNSDVTLSGERTEMENCRFDGYIVIRGDGVEAARMVLNALKLTYTIDSQRNFLISGKCGD